MASSTHGRAALVVLYESMGGAAWVNSSGWMVGEPCAGRWHGVKCDSENYVTELCAHAPKSFYRITRSVTWHA